MQTPHKSVLQDATVLLVLSCDLTKPLPFLCPASIPFVCIIHLKAAVAHPHDMDTLALTSGREQ